jgi:hypothetical protein
MTTRTKRPEGELTARASGRTNARGSVEDWFVTTDVIWNTDRVLASLEDLIRVLRGSLSETLASGISVPRQELHVFRPHGTEAKRSPRVIERLTRKFKPADVRILFLSAPPTDPNDPTSFYLGNGHTFRCMRAAFARAFGPDAPVGQDFVSHFRDRRCWIVSMAPRFKKKRGRPSTETVEEEARFIASVMRQATPRYVVALRESIGAATVEAAKSLRIPDGRVYRLSTPNDLWKDPFVEFLAEALSD